MLYSEFQAIASALGWTNLNYEFFEDCEAAYVRSAEFDKQKFVQGWLSPRKKCAFLVSEYTRYCGRDSHTLYIFRSKEQCINFLNITWNMGISHSATKNEIQNRLFGEICSPACGTIYFMGRGNGLTLAEEEKTATDVQDYSTDTCWNTKEANPYPAC